MAYLIGSKNKNTKAISLDKMIDDIHENHPIKVHRHLHWVSLMAMYEGYQSSYADWENDELKDIILDSEERSDYNLLGGFVDVFVAKMLARDPIPQVRPVNAHEKDIDAATKKSLALQHWWYKENLRAVWHDVLIWAATIGTGIIKCYWNKDSGLPINIGQESIKEGEVSAMSLDPFTWFPDPTAIDDYGMKWGVHSYSQSVERVKQLWPKEAKNIQPEDKLSEYKSVLSSYTSDYTYTGGASVSALGEENVRINEYWERGVDGVDSGHGSGKGLLKIRASNITLYEGPNPYEEDLPFFTYPVSKLPYSLWGRGLVDRLVVPQKDLNRLFSQTMNNVDYMGNKKILNPKECGVDAELMNREEGGIIDYSASMGAEPHEMVMTPFDSSILALQDSIKQTMMHISGFHEISFAQLPERASQTSGRVTDVLVESEETRFSPEVNRLKEKMEDLGTFYLKLAEKNYDSSWTAAIADKYVGTVRSAKFTGKDLKGNAQVYIEVESGFGLSPTAKAERLMMMWDRGLEQDPDVIKRNLRYGTVENIYRDAVSDQFKAYRHLKMIVEDGVTPDISKYDNHEVIIKEFLTYIRSSDYDKLSIEQKNAIEGYLDKHYQYLQMQMPQRQQQGPQQGSPSATQGQMDASMGQATGAPMQGNIQDQPTGVGV